MPDLYSSERTRRVVRLDGGTRVVLVHRRGQDWERVRGRLRLTPASVQRLQQEQVVELELRRWFRRARTPLNWLPQSSTRTLSGQHQAAPSQAAPSRQHRARQH